MSARLDSLTSWHADWSGLRVAVLGLSMTGFSAADTLIACSRSRRERAAHSGREVVSMPPSPVVRILRGWKDQAAISAPAPTGRPR